MSDTMTPELPECPHGHGPMKLLARANMLQCMTCGFIQHKKAFGGHSAIDYANTWRERHEMAGYHFDLDSMPETRPDDPEIVSQAIERKREKMRTGRFESWGEIMDMIEAQTNGLMRQGVMPERIEVNGHNYGVLERTYFGVAPKYDDGRPMPFGHVDVKGFGVLPITIASEPASLKAGVDVVGRLVEAETPRKMLQLKAMQVSALRIPCPVCQGAGYEDDDEKTCGFCEGLGWTTEAEYADVALKILRDEETGDNS